RPGHDNLADRPAALVAGDEVHLLEPFVGDRQVADGDVAEALGQVGQQLVAGRGSDVDRERPLAELLRVLEVEVALPVADELDRDSALTALVAVVERARKWRIDADHATLEHLVEVAGPRLVLDLELARLGGRRGGRSLRVARAREGEQSKADGERAADASRSIRNRHH